MGLLPAISNLSCGPDIEKVVDKIAELELMCQQWEMHGIVEVPDQVKLAVLAKSTPEPMRTPLLR